MAKKRLPLRPNTSTRFSLEEKERMALCLYCVFECTKMAAFTVAHPELMGTPAIQKRKCDEFFSSGDVIGFINEYRAFLSSIEAENQPSEESVKAEPSDADREERKRKALVMLADDIVDQIFALREGDESIDRETILKMVDRIGWLGDEEKMPEEPRRYLPEMCSQCRYKLWIEENCEEA